ncbi:MAG: N-acetylglucosamine-6-phosphate deacetylase [Planctomycetota bacterium]|nr:MAG: N-acetylglucosamine-6-phosphate deacetylase [Planctomycetota bacterium]
MKLTGRTLLADGKLRSGTLTLADGRVRGFTPGPARPCFVLPGFVDLHVHGGGGADVMDGAEGVAAVASFHLRHGTTALCPTTVTRPLRELEAAVAAVGSVSDGPERARILGTHLEGPFLAPARLGAQPPHALAPDPQALRRLLAAGPVAAVTLAPELPGALELVRLLVGRGIRVGLGHTDCDAAEAAAAFEEGAGGATHLFNAMRGLHHRKPGLAAAALEAPKTVHEIILDGVHVHPSLFRIAYRAARGRLALVSDAVRACGLPPGESELGGQRIVVAADRATLGDGTLAGSILTLDRALRKAVSAGLSVEEASDLLSRNPADALGRTDLGRIVPGGPADVVVLDEDLRLRSVLRGGQEVDLGA